LYLTNQNWFQRKQFFKNQNKNKNQFYSHLLTC